MLIKNYCVQGALLGAVWAKMIKMWILPTRPLWSSMENEREINGNEKTIESQKCYGCSEDEQILLLAGGRSGCRNRIRMDGVFIFCLQVS